MTFPSTALDRWLQDAPEPPEIDVEPEEDPRDEYDRDDAQEHLDALHDYLSQGGRP